MIKYGFYLLAKMVRPAPGGTEPAANEPGTGGEGPGSSIVPSQQT